MARSGMTWRGDKDVSRRMDEYKRRVLAVQHSVADYFAAVIEAYAKENAGWTDRTGNARQGLFTVVKDLAHDVVALYLSHSMDYGKWLELKNSQKYAIIMPALEAHYDAVMKMLRGALK